MVKLRKRLFSVKTQCSWLLLLLCVPRVFAGGPDKELSGPQSRVIHSAIRKQLSPELVNKLEMTPSDQKISIEFALADLDTFLFIARADNVEDSSQHDLDVEDVFEYSQRLNSAIDKIDNIKRNFLDARVEKQYQSSVDFLTYIVNKIAVKHPGHVFFWESSMRFPSVGSRHWVVTSSPEILIELLDYKVPDQIEVALIYSNPVPGEKYLSERDSQMERVMELAERKLHAMSFRGKLENLFDSCKKLLRKR